MSRPIVYGQPAHLHVRSVLFALAEKDVVYRVKPRDEMPLLGGQSPGGRFGVPILDVGGHLVQGAETVLRFVADAFAGPALQPAEARERARMNSALELNYREATSTLGSQIAGRYIAALVSSDWLDPKPSEDVLADARKTVAEFERILRDDPFLAGPVLSLADIALASLLDNIMETPDRELVVPANSRLGLWWGRVSSRRAFQATRPEGGALFGFMYPPKLIEEQETG
jgi:glutathione S-transferase